MFVFTFELSFGIFWWLAAIQTEYRKCCPLNSPSAWEMVVLWRVDYRRRLLLFVLIAGRGDAGSTRRELLPQVHGHNAS